MTVDRVTAEGRGRFPGQEKYNVAVKRILETNETSIKLFYNQTHLNFLITYLI